MSQGFDIKHVLNQELTDITAQTFELAWKVVKAGNSF
jgi:hypothetical protein